MTTLENRPEGLVIDRIANPIGPDNRPPDLDVTRWCQALRARGVTFRITGGRLRVWPWKYLTPTDQATLRQHREAIKQLVRTGVPTDETTAHEPETQTETQTGDAGPTPAITTAQAVESEAAPAPGLIERLRIIHGNEPQEVERRRLENTAVMFKMMGYGHPDY